MYPNLQLLVSIDITVDSENFILIYSVNQKLHLSELISMVLQLNTLY